MVSESSLLKIMPAENKWVVADEALIRGLRQHCLVVRGTKGRILKYGLRFIPSYSLKYFFSFIFLICSVLYLWLRQILFTECDTKITLDAKSVVNIFVRSGARNEDEILNSYRMEALYKVLVIPDHDVSCLSCYARIDFFPLVIETIGAFNSIIKVVNLSCHSAPLYRLDILTSALMRAALYSFYSCWWRAISQICMINEVYFISAGMCAFSTSQKNLNTTFHQHGLLGKDVLFPSFNSVRALTLYDAHYLRQIIPTADVTSCTPFTSLGITNSDKSNKLLFVLGGLTQGIIAHYQSVISSFKQLGIPIYVRPVPGASGLASKTFWREKFASHDIKVTFLDAAIPFQELLNDLNPSLVASWYSTALVDALYSGIIPVCLADGDDEAIVDIVFPLMACSLQFTQDMNIIHLALSNHLEYQSILAELRLRERLMIFNNN